MRELKWCCLNCGLGQAPILLITSVIYCITGVTPKLTKMTHLSQMQITGYTHFCLISLTVLFSQRVSDFGFKVTFIHLEEWGGGICKSGAAILFDTT